MENFTSTAAEQLKIALRKKVGRSHALCACGGAYCRSRPEAAARRQVHPLNHNFHLKLQDGKFFRSQLNTHVTGGFVATVRGAAGTGRGRLGSACQLSMAP